MHAGIIWTDVLLMDEVLHEAALPNYSLEVFLGKSFELLIYFNMYLHFFNVPNYYIFFIISF
jgi:hypothetical protein